MAVYKDGDKWRVIYRYTNYKGERKQTQKRGFATKREAVAGEREVMLKSESKLDMTFASFFEIYEEDKKKRVNTAIYEREKQLANVEKELAGAKGIFKAKQRKELQEQAEQLKTQIGNMKQYLSSIVQSYGYKNVKEFLAEYKASKAEYTDYQSAVARWEQQTGNKAGSDSLKAKLQRKTQEVKERENNRQSHQHKKDRGGR